mgnify:CR=1 FL=1
MSIEIKDKKEELWYVWTKSERAGDIVKPSNDQKDPKWFKFTDGTQINRELINEFLISAKSENEATKYSKDIGGLGHIKNTKEAEKTSTIQSTERRITDGKLKPDAEVNIMMEMLKKISKKNKAEMPVQVSIPTKEVYEMLQDQMDLKPDDLNNQIGMLVESQIDNLRNQLKEQIEIFIFNYYKDERK